MIKELLIESYISLLLENYRLDQINQMIQKQNIEINQETLDQLLEADPTGTKENPGKYVIWIAKMYLKSNNKDRFLEDLYKVKDDLKIYHDLKIRNKLQGEKRDINKVQSAKELYEIVKGEDESLNFFPDISEYKDQIDVVLDTKTKKVYVPKTFYAAKKLGEDTRWCTTQKSMYDHYSKQGDLYVIMILKGQKIDKYQFHFESKQFMNSKDIVVEMEHVGKDVIQAIFHYTKNNIIKCITKPKYINKIEEDEQIKVLSKVGLMLYKNIKTLSPKVIEYLENKSGVKGLFSNPNETTQLEAIGQNPYFICYIENPSEKVQIEAVKKNGNIIQYIQNPSEKVQLEAVKQDGNAIYYIKKPSEKVQLEAVKKAGYVIECIKNPSEQIKLEAVKQNEYSIRYIENPSEELQLIAVKSNKNVIIHIKNPSEQTQLEAIKQNAYAIRDIKNLSEKVQLEAVRKNGNAISYIKNPSEKVQLEAVRQNGNAINYIENPSEEVQLKAVQQEETAIRYIKNPSEKVQLEAIKQANCPIYYINNPTQKVKDIIAIQADEWRKWEDK